MKTLSIFEPAMCCPTGLCGVGVDPELLRVSAAVNALKRNGIQIGRYNLANSPMKFVANRAVNDFLRDNGPEKLPVTLVDGAVVLSGRYPTNREFTALLGLPEHLLEGGKC